MKQLKSFNYEFYGGIFTGRVLSKQSESKGFKNITSYLVKQGEPIPLRLLRKTHVSIGPRRPKHHPISGELINYGQVPFGYKDINGTLHKDPLEQFVLQQIRVMKDDGSSLNGIAKYLTASGVPANPSINSGQEMAVDGRAIR